MKKYNNNNFTTFKKETRRYIYIWCCVYKINSIIILSNKGKSKLFLEEHNTINIYNNLLLLFEKKLKKFRYIIFK